MWEAAIVAWIVLCVVGYHLYTKSSLVEFLQNLLGVVIIVAVIATVMGLIFLVFFIIPEWLFGNVGLGVGLFTLFSGLIYLTMFEDNQRYRNPHTRTLKHLVLTWAVVLPPLFMLSQIG